LEKQKPPLQVGGWHALPYQYIWTAKIM